jgi:hypothetical protein
MSVVIDEFEVVANEDEGSEPIASPAVTNNAASSVTVHDIERVVERQCERYERVWAH